MSKSSPAFSLSKLSDEIHIWQVDLRINESQQQALTLTLNEAELERANRYYFARHQRRFIAARAALRAVLANYLAISSDEVSFNYGKYGKPGLSDAHHSQLRFNLSHSGECAVIALTQHDDIGIDVEQFSERDFLALATRYFSKEEVAALNQQPASQHQASFFHIWSQKEAFIKATGMGIHFGLDKFSVSVTPPAKLITVDPTTRFNSSDWRLYDFQPLAGYQACIAIKNGEKTRYFFNWNFSSCC